MANHLPAERLLREQHRQMLSIAEEIRRTVRLNPADLMTAIAPMRMALATVLRAHLADEKSLLIDHLKGDLRTLVPMLDTVQRRALALRVAYSSHIATWTSAAVDADPDSYVAALDRLLAELEIQIAFEERDLFGPGFRALRRLPIAC